MYSDKEITRILEKLENATNRNLPGALSDEDFEILKGHLRSADKMLAMVRECADKLIVACHPT